jgi:hypothetical protein
MVDIESADKTAPVISVRFKLASFFWAQKPNLQRKRWFPRIACFSRIEMNALPPAIWADATKPCGTYRIVPASGEPTNGSAVDTHGY